MFPIHIFKKICDKSLNRSEICVARSLFWSSVFGKGSFISPIAIFSYRADEAPLNEIISALCTVVLYLSHTALFSMHCVVCLFILYSLYDNNNNNNNLLSCPPFVSFPVSWAGYAMSSGCLIWTQQTFVRSSLRFLTTVDAITVNKPSRRMRRLKRQRIRRYDLWYTTTSFRHLLRSVIKDRRFIC